MEKYSHGGYNAGSVTACPTRTKVHWKYWKCCLFISVDHWERLKHNESDNFLWKQTWNKGLDKDRARDGLTAHSGWIIGITLYK